MSSHNSCDDNMRVWHETAYPHQCHSNTCKQMIEKKSSHNNYNNRCPLCHTCICIWDVHWCLSRTLKEMLRDLEVDLCCVIGNSIYVARSGIRSMFHDREFDLCCVIRNSIYVVCSEIKSMLCDRNLIYVSRSGVRSMWHDREFDLICTIENSI